MSTPPEDPAKPPATVAVIGAGPTGLAAAEHLTARGLSVVVHERMPSPARKFLLAGRGGLNLTHSEEAEAFLSRYGAPHPLLRRAIEAWPPERLRAWAAGLGEETFAGTSGRVFPKSFKATPLLRAWLRRLEGMGVEFAFRHRWTGWTEDGALRFETPAGEARMRPAATLLALGGASWPRLGSDGSWLEILRGAGVQAAPLAASNCGFVINWSEAFRSRFQGQPLKACRFSVRGREARSEAVIIRSGLEGGAIYALAGAMREALAAGEAEIVIDLKPDIDQAALAAKLSSTRKGETLSNRLRKAAGLSAAAIGMLRESQGGPPPNENGALAARIKACRIAVSGIAGIERAISSAGGVAFDALDDRFMLRARPGVFVAGEMLDWDAPTGGYLLQACFSTGVAAAVGIAQWVGRSPAK